MTDPGELALLPAGLQDILPPEAAHEAAVVDAWWRASPARATSGSSRP